MIGRLSGAALALAGLLSTTPALAFCGFYVSGADAKLFNNATQVVLMREGTRTVLSMQNNYEGPPSKFAMVVPVPVVLQKENVKTLPRALFDKVDQLDAPRLVEYWEQDPCSAPMIPRTPGIGGRTKPMPRAAGAAKEAKDLGVTVEAEFTVGEYEVVILSAKDAAGLDTWLKQEKYTIPDGSEPYFRPYVQAGSKFFVARVDVQKVTFEKGMATLSPLRFHYDAEQFTLPVRLGLVNSSGTQDLIVHVLARGQRYELANYPNATIPTNFDVAENARDRFGSFYAALFDRTLEKNPKAVITEYAWDASTCDPCPGPALTGNDLATLGMDVLPSAVKPTPGGGPPGRGFRYMPSGYVITRLHARYGKESLGEDLVFRAAPPIVGGREMWSAKPRADDAGPAGPGERELENGAAPSGFNNFQGRYAIRHPWGGPIECKEPRRGIWGGPPYSPKPAEPSAAPRAAKDLAFVPRDAKLAGFVRSEIRELGLKGEGPPVSPVLPATPAASVSGSHATTPPAASATPGAPTRQGCMGCTAASSRDDGLGAIAGLGAAIMLFGRRRARRPITRGP